MKETLKFIFLKKHTLDQTDKDIAKYEYQKTMDALYETFKKVMPFGAKKVRDNEERDQMMKNAIQRIKNTHKLIGYFEIISDTDKENVKKISIVLSKNGSKERYSEAELFLLKDKLQNAYALYNKVVSNPKYEAPFLERDGNFLFNDRQIKADMNSISKLGDAISQQTGIDLTMISKMIDIAIDKIDTKK